MQRNVSLFVFLGINAVPSVPHSQRRCSQLIPITSEPEFNSTLPFHLSSLTLTVLSFSLPFQTLSVMMASSFSIPIFSIMLAFLLISSSEGRDFSVGGSESSWTLPLPSPDSLNHWAQKQRFRIGDSLLWNYDQRSESVLQVREQDYGSCNISEPIVEYNDGDTKVELDRSGPFYFVSGADGHCQKGLKVAVVVISDSHGGRHYSPAPAPEPEESAPPPEKGGAASLSGGVQLVGLVMGLGVSLVTMIVSV